MQFQLEIGLFRVVEDPVPVNIVTTLVKMIFLSCCAIQWIAYPLRLNGLVEPTSADSILLIKFLNRALSRQCLQILLRLIACLLRDEAGRLSQNATTLAWLGRSHLLLLMSKLVVYA